MNEKEKERLKQRLEEELAAEKKDMLVKCENNAGCIELEKEKERAMTELNSEKKARRSDERDSEHTFGRNCRKGQTRAASARDRAQAVMDLAAEKEASASLPRRRSTLNTRSKWQSAV